MCWAERQAKGQKPCQETALARFSQEHLGETKTQQQYGWEDSQRESTSLIDLEMLPNVRDGSFLPCSTVGINFASIQICEAAKLWAGKSGAAFFFLKGGNVDTLSHQKDWGLGSVRAAMERKWLHMTEKRNLRGHLLHQVLLHFVVIAKRQGTLFFLRTRLKTFVNGESAEAVTVKWKTKQKYGKAISIFNWVNIAVTHPSFSCKTSVATKIRARGCTFVHVIFSFVNVWASNSKYRLYFAPLVGTCLHCTLDKAEMCGLQQSRLNVLRS